MGSSQSLNDTLIVINNISIKNVNSKIKKIIFDSNCDGNPQLLLDDNLTIETIDMRKKYYYDGSLEHLPPKLINLYLNNSIWKKIENFPQSLKNLNCTDEFYFRQTNIPVTLKKLIIIQSGIKPDDNFVLGTLNLPENLEELSFEYEDEYEPNSFYLNNLSKLFNNLPKNLKILNIPSFWNNPLLNLPTKLEVLYLGIKYNQSLDFLPESIKHIEFVEGCKFNKPLHNLPSQLEHLNLQFQNKCTYTISNLPNSIKYLEIGEYELEIGKLPTELIELAIASPVKFNYAKTEFVKKLNDKNNLVFTQTKYYILSLVGKYNIQNNITIKIPSNLSVVTWWDGKYSTYKFKKCPNNNLWFECAN